MSDPATDMALLRFDVTAAFEELPEWNRFQSDLETALAGAIDIDRRLVEREARYSRYRAPTAARAPEVRVIFDNRSTTDSTIVEVRAPDRGPVLYRVAHALAASGVTITCALVSTLGAEAIDVFYVRQFGGGRVTDPATLELLREAITATL